MRLVYLVDTSAQSLAQHILMYTVILEHPDTNTDHICLLATGR